MVGILEEGGRIVNMLIVPARDLRPHDVTLSSRLRVISIQNGGDTGKMCLTLERLAGPKAGTLRVAEWGRGTKINIHRPEPCPHCGGRGIKRGTIGAGCGKCEHGRTPPPFLVFPVPSKASS